MKGLIMFNASNSNEEMLPRKLRALRKLCLKYYQDSNFNISADYVKKIEERFWAQLDGFLGKNMLYMRAQDHTLSCYDLERVRSCFYCFDQVASDEYIPKATLLNGLKDYVLVHEGEKQEMRMDRGCLSMGVIQSTAEKVVSSGGFAVREIRLCETSNHISFLEYYVSSKFIPDLYDKIHDKLLDCFKRVCNRYLDRDDIKQKSIKQFIDNDCGFLNEARDELCDNKHLAKPDSKIDPISLDQVSSQINGLSID